MHIASAQELGPWMQGRSWSTWSEHAPWIDVDEVLRQSRISWDIERKQIEHPSSAEVVGPVVDMPEIVHGVSGKQERVPVVSSQDRCAFSIESPVHKVRMVSWFGP